MLCDCPFPQKTTSLWNMTYCLSISLSVYLSIYLIDLSCLPSYLWQWEWLDGMVDHVHIMYSIYVATIFYKPGSQKYGTQRIRCTIVANIIYCIITFSIFQMYSCLFWLTSMMTTELAGLSDEVIMSSSCGSYRILLIGSLWIFGMCW